MRKFFIYKITLTVLCSICLSVNGYSESSSDTSACQYPIYRADISTSFTDNFFPFTNRPAIVVGPFACSSSWYQTYQAGAWFIGEYNFNNLAALSVFGAYGINSHKSIGYNTLDNFIYTIKGNGTVLRMHNDGSEDDLGVALSTGLPTTLTATEYFGVQMGVGGFNDSGTYYFKSTQGSPVGVLDVTLSPPIFSVSLPGTDFLANDWAFHSGTSTFYGVENGSLWSYDGGTGVSSTGLTLSTCESGVNLNGAFGSAYYTADGFIYVVQNSSGNIYQIDVLNNTAKYILNGPTPLNQPDGASCPTALPPFPTVFAEDDEFCLDGDGNGTFSTQFDNDIVNQSTVDLASFSIVTVPSFGTTIYDSSTGELTYTSTGTPQNDVLTYKICATDQMSSQQICCCAEISLSASPMATFDPFGPYCQNETPDLLPSLSNEGVNGSWTPSTISTAVTGDADYIFESSTGSACESMTSITITVNASVTTEFTIITDYCVGDTEPVLPLLDNNGIAGTWDATSISTVTDGMTDYEFTPDDPTLCASDFTLSVTVNPIETPDFALSTLYCQDDPEPNLPLIDDNGITGTWDATNISTSSPGMTDYLFTPDDPAQCASDFTLAITVTPSATPAFSISIVYCQNDPEPNLPIIDDNGITGTWDVTNISTTSPGMKDYLFTPDDPAQCASNFTLTVTVIPNETSTFSISTMYCQNDPEPNLPLIDDNGITGTWDATNISTSSPGMTDYLFTPDDPTQCATDFTLAVTVTPNATPTFSISTVYCQNDPEPNLPLMDDNGITGTWDAINISTSSPGMTDYLFTPDDPAQCASNFTLTVTVTLNTTPAFSISTLYCQDDPEPNLPNTDDNGITGTWDASNISTSSPGMTDYLFTPDDPTQCASNFTLTVTVTSNATPVFSISTEYCQDDPEPNLPIIDDNGITGTWDAANISTSSPGMTDYLFTPDNPTQCASNFTLTVTVTLTVTPAFSISTIYCQDDSEPNLPFVDNNGITGIWDATSISTSLPGTVDYTFTPDDPTDCASDFILTVTVTETIPPEFSINTLYCQDDPEPSLPFIDNNGITGTWDATVISTSSPGMTDYLFIPDDPAQCVSNFILSVTVELNIDLTFTITDIYCIDEVPDILPEVSNEGINGTWSQITINTSTAGTTDYFFTPSGPGCYNVFTLNVTIEDCDCTNPATVDIGPIGPICEDETIDLLAILGGSATSVSWTTSGDGSFDDVNSLTPEYTPSSADIIAGSVTLTATTDDPDGSGLCTAAATNVILIINTQETPIFNIQDEYCEDEATDPLPQFSDNGISGTWDATQINNTTSASYTFTPDDSECAVVYILMVDIIPNVNPTFNIEDLYCIDDIADDLSNISDNGINGTWSPSTINTSIANSDTYTFTPDLAICAIPFSILITVENCGCVDPPTVDIEPISSICENETINLVATIGGGASTVSWTTNGDGNFDDELLLTAEYTPGTSDITLGNVTLTVITDDPDGGDACMPASANVMLTVDTLINPIFNIQDSYCEGSTTDPLSLLSDNGISGTWDATQIDDTSSSIYTFTPDVAQCANEYTLVVNIDLKIDPAFSIEDTYCEGSTTDPLPSTSDNGMSGTWDAVQIDNTTSTTYTFTPDGIFCANEYELVVDIVINDIPVFILSDTYCIGDVAETLPSVSDNGINGTWSPVEINTTSANTNIYTFTPEESLCANPFSISISVNDCDCADPALVDIDPILSICENETVSLLSVLGGSATMLTWTTDGDGTFDDINSLTPIYTPGSIDVVSGPILLTATTNDPDGSGLCSAASSTVNLVINANETPIFSVGDSYCVGDTPDQLTTTSNNGITGSWDISQIDNTTSASYTFTPNISECAIEFVLDVIITPNAVPEFNFVDTYCIGDLLDILQPISDNGISGTWTPSVINTSMVSSEIFTFTPDANICANPFSITILIEECDCNNPPTISINPVSAICENENIEVVGIIGGGASNITWMTSGDGSFDDSQILNPIYTPGSSDITLGSVSLFATTDDPDGGGVCIAATASVNLIINTFDIPIFVLNDTYCLEDMAGVLVSTSDNGITGTWTPDVINLSMPNNTLYTFTPDLNSCVSSFSIMIFVSDCGCVDPPSVAVDPITTICFNETLNLVATPGGGTSNITWTTNGDGSFNDDNILTPIYTPGEADIDANSVTLTVSTDDPDGSGPCVSDTEQLIVAINEVVFLTNITSAECESVNTGSIDIDNVSGGVEPYQYSIDNGETYFDSNDFNDLEPGEYQIVINDSNGCSSSQNVILEQVASPYIELGQDTTLQLGQEINLTVFHDLDSSEIESIIWTPSDNLSCSDCLDPTVTPTSTIIYQVMITDTMGCVAEAEIALTILSDDNEFTPNIFSPNRDGNNDMFMLYPNLKVEAIDVLTIYDRWGNVVFVGKSLEPGNFGSGWDGTNNGQDVTPGVFIYIAKLRMKDGNSEFIKGDITLIK